jgi:tRNA(fMet)-specific endonuclease VapC
VSYVFDTDILSNTIKKTPSQDLLRRLSETPPDEQFTTTVTVGEMVYGALRSGRANELIQRLQTDIWPNVNILAFDVAAAEVYGALRAGLEKEGITVAEADLRIAAIARSRGMTLVTGNVRHFQRIPNLIVENWL